MPQYSTIFLQILNQGDGTYYEYYIHVVKKSCTFSLTSDRDAKHPTHNLTPTCARANWWNFTTFAGSSSQLIDGWCILVQDKILVLYKSPTDHFAHCPQYSTIYLESLNQRKKSLYEHYKIMKKSKSPWREGHLLHLQHWHRTWHPAGSALCLVYLVTQHEWRMNCAEKDNKYI